MKDVSQYQESSNVCHIVLPLELLSALCRIQARLTQTNNYRRLLMQLTSDVNEQLTVISKGLPRKITPGRLKSHFEYHRGHAGISRVEYAVLSDKSINNVSQASYINFDGSALGQKHGYFIKQVLGPDFFTIPNNDNKSFGSYMIPDDEEIYQLYDDLYRQQETINKYDFRAIHNLKTMLCANLLQLVTLHRPVVGMFRTIHHFDADFSWAVFSDKGEESERKVPIGVTGSMLVKGYMNHISEFIQKTRLTYPNVHSQLTSVLNGECNIFLVWTSADKLRDINPKLDYQKYFDFPYPPNWHRHKGATELYRQKVDLELLAAYMGHDPEQDKNMYQYGALTYNSLKQVSRAIDLLAQNLVPSSLMSASMENK